MILIVMMLHFHQKYLQVQLPLTESEETTHYSVTDSYGNAVSVTTTLNGGLW